MQTYVSILPSVNSYFTTQELTTAPGHFEDRKMNWIVFNCFRSIIKANYSQNQCPNIKPNINKTQDHMPADQLATSW